MDPRRSRTLAALSLLAAACTAPETVRVAADAGTSTGGSGGGAGGSLATGGAGGTTTGGAGGDPGQAVPFAVDDYFIPSGFMGDGSMAGAVTMLPAAPADDKLCGGQRARPNAAGNCHQATYVKPAAGSLGWGGVYWQYPIDNWGLKPGLPIAAGAHQVSFYVRGDAGATVTFLAGGIDAPNVPYKDTFKASSAVTLTGAWTQVTLDVAGQSYGAVIGGFGWTAEASVTFSIDDIQWQ